MTLSLMTNSSSISVVVPSYNHARFVSTCLRSIIKQSTPPTKLLVIDDGSTDGSPQAIESVLRDCPFPCELLVRENRGLCATLNQGLELTSGEYFAYLGSDDVWLEKFLRKRVELLNRRPKAVLAYGHAYLIDEDNRIVDCTEAWANYTDGDARSMLLQTIAPMSPTVVYRRVHLENHRWNQSSRLEDYELYLRLSLDGEFAFDPEPLAAWRRHQRNTSRDQMLMLEEHLTALRKINLPDFGMTGKEIARLQSRVKFARAEDFLRLGDKATALRLMTQNLSGASSAGATMRMMLRLLLPYRLVELRKNDSKRKAMERYGKIVI